MRRRFLFCRSQKSLGVDFEKRRARKVDLDGVAVAFDKCKIAEVVNVYARYHGNSLVGTSREIVGAAAGYRHTPLHRPQRAAHGACSGGLDFIIVKDNNYNYKDFMRNQLFALCTLILLTIPAKAQDGLSLQAFGKAVHTKGCGQGCSEKNNGAGLEYGWKSNLVNAGFIKNSFFRDSGYLGYGKSLTLGKDFYGSAGLWAGAIYYSTPRRKQQIYGAVLPMLSLGFKAVSINAVYIPDVREVIPAWLFSVKIKVWEAP